MILFTDENDENKRLDSFLSEITPELSRSKIQNLIKSGSVKVNGQIKKSSYLLKEGDKIEFEAPPEEDLNGEDLSDINGEFRRGILHRLDRNTSGLLMIAKNNKAHEYLAEQIKNHTITKKYRAIVKGIIDEDEFEINAPIARNPNQPHKMTVKDDGKPSKTLVKVLERFKDATYIELTLITGRTHQIRVHMKSINHPVYNDTLYGAGQGKVKTDEQVLQSYFLRFTKPFGGEIIELQIEPDDKIKKVLKYLRS